MIALQESSDFHRQSATETGKIGKDQLKISKLESGDYLFDNFAEDIG